MYNMFIKPVQNYIIKYERNVFFFVFFCLTNREETKFLGASRPFFDYYKKCTNVLSNPFIKLHYKNTKEISSFCLLWERGLANAHFGIPLYWPVTSHQ